MRMVVLIGIHVYCTVFDRAVKHYISTPQFRSYFLIKYQYLSKYQTWDHIRTKSTTCILSNIEDKSMLPDKHIWILDTQPDGSFKMISCVDKQLLQFDEGNGLSLSSSSDGYQFWRREGNFIISGKKNWYIGMDYNDEMLLSIHCKDKCTGDMWGQMNFSPIIHEETGLCLTCKSSSGKEIEDNSEVILSAINNPPNDNQYWSINQRQDGTFTIFSKSKELFVITCEDDTSSLEKIKLIMEKCTTCSENGQLWRISAGYIESVKFEGHVISCSSESDLVLSIKEMTNKQQLFKYEVRFTKKL